MTALSLQSQKVYMARAICMCISPFCLLSCLPSSFIKCRSGCHGTHPPFMHHAPFGSCGVEQIEAPNSHT